MDRPITIEKLARIRRRLATEADAASTNPPLGKGDGTKSRRHPEGNRQAQLIYKVSCFAVAFSGRRGGRYALRCYRPRFKAFFTFVRLLPTFLTAFFTAPAERPVFFAVYLTS
jgi:hypothetical protein